MGLDSIDDILDPEDIVHPVWNWRAESIFWYFQRDAKITPHDSLREASVLKPTKFEQSIGKCVYILHTAEPARP